MIRAIVAMDSNQGIARASDIPWHLPPDRKRFRQLTEQAAVLMGYNTYNEFKAPLQNRRNYVWCRPGTKLRDGFEPVYELGEFLGKPPHDIWIIGGGNLYATALSYCEELYITQLGSDYDCTIFFPEFRSAFSLVSESSHQHDGLQYSYQLWRR
jgi:dihydrofolate reductase